MFSADSMSTWLGRYISFGIIIKEEKEWHKKGAEYGLACLNKIQSGTTVLIGQKCPLGKSAPDYTPLYIFWIVAVS